MELNTLTPAQTRELRKDARNIKTPFKVIASGFQMPLRFEKEKQALDFFNSHPGTCIFSYNTDHSVKILRYKFIEK